MSQPHRRSPSRSAPRGYVLIIVMVLGVGAALATAVLINTSGGARIAAVHTKGGDLAAAYAQAGMERALAYVDSMVGGGDLDRVLDPGLLTTGTTADDANCGSGADTLDDAMPSPGSPNLLYTPSFTDGTRITFEGKRYTRVPYGEGAYLVRFDDDDDDASSAPTLGGATNNNTNNNCVEGRASLSRGQNPVRDRNRTVWITVIGITSGTDPTAASHRVALRRLHVATMPPSVAGIQVRGNVNTGGSSVLAACSPIGGLAIDGNVSSGGSGQLCTCGTSFADQWNGGGSNLGHCNDAAFASLCTVPCADGTREEPGPLVPQLDGMMNGGQPRSADFFFDFDRPCIFYLDNVTSSSLGLNGIWFWDSEAERGPDTDGDGNPDRCGSLEGRNLAFPGPPNPGQAGTSWSGCWTPLILRTNTGTCFWAAPGDSELPPGTCDWAPDGDPTSAATVTTATFTLTPLSFGDDVNTRISNVLSAAGFGPNLAHFIPAGFEVNKPDWADKCQIQYPSNGSAFHCTTADGCVADNAAGATPNVAVTWNGGVWWFPVSNMNEVRAIPAGVYFYPSNVNLTGSGYDFGMAPPGTTPLGTSPAPDYPLITFAVNGSFSLQRPGYFWASGQTGGANGVVLPAVIGGNNVELQGGGDSAIVGSIYADGDFTWSGNGDMILYGELYVDSNFNLTGAGTFEWRYTQALQPPPPTAGYPPTSSRIAR